MTYLSPITGTLASRTETRIAALHFPWFESERLMRREPALRRLPFALIEEARGRLALTAVNPRAAASGLKPGMALADARAVLPELSTRFARPEEDRRALSRLAVWATRYSPGPAVGDGHSLFLDLTGAAHLFGGEEAWAKQVLSRLEEFGLSASLAVAPTAGAAWALAAYGGERQMLLPADADLSGALSALPVSALRLSPADVDALMGFGLHRIGDLYALSRRSLGDRFDAEVVMRLEQALGCREEPVAAERAGEVFDGRIAFAEPIGAPEDIEAAALKALEELCLKLNQAGRGARRFCLVAHRVNGARQRLTVGTTRPVRWPQPVMGLLREKLDSIDPGFGIEVISVDAGGIEALKGFQADWHRRGAHNSLAEREALSQLLDRLGNRFGLSRIHQVRPCQSWLPERAITQNAPGGKAAKTAPVWPKGRARPLRLLPRPEPVEATAPIPDDPPVLFRWHGKAYRISRADGPERLASEWWREEAEPRDYYLVEADDGRRFWLYRDGLYQDGIPPRWFVHGVFA